MKYGISILFEYTPALTGCIIFSKWALDDDIYIYGLISIYVIYLISKPFQFRRIYKKLSYAQSSGFYPQGLNGEISMMRGTLVIDCCFIVVGYISIITFLL